MTVKLQVEIPVEDLGGILLADDPTCYPLIRLAQTVQQTLQRSLGWSMEVEAELEGHMGRRTNYRRQMLELVQRWAETRVRELESLAELSNGDWAGEIEVYRRDL